MRWNVLLHPEVEEWIKKLPASEQIHVIAALKMLADHGPGLGRPLVDSVRYSNFSNMKELRVSKYRLLFAFDRKRSAVVFIGGSKQDRWQSWYVKNIPIADERFSIHLKLIDLKGK